MSLDIQFRKLQLTAFIRAYRKIYKRAPCGVYVLFLADGTAVYVGETIGGKEFRLSRHLGNPRSDPVCDRLFMPGDIAWFEFHILPPGSTKAQVTQLERQIAQQFDTLVNVKTLGTPSDAVLPEVTVKRHYLMRPERIALEATLEAQITIAEERVVDIERWLKHKDTDGVKRGRKVWKARLAALLASDLRIAA